MGKNPFMGQNLKMFVDFEYSEEALASVVSEAPKQPKRRVGRFDDDVCADYSLVTGNRWPPFAAGANNFTVRRCAQEYLHHNTLFATKQVFVS